MKRNFLAAGLAVILIPLLIWGALSLWGGNIMNASLKPGHTRAEESITVPPDYRDDRYWASLPGQPGLANMVPDGQIGRESHADIAVFYVHPTSYLSGKRWNSPLFTETWGWEMVTRMMFTQGSAFNACCDVYAPHYREATLWSFIERDTDDGLQALDVAYRDISSAFDEFLWRFDNDRPFIIASHSQGTAHALRLLIERVNNTSLRNRLVAAYLIGYQLPVDYFERELTDIPPCESATQTGCVVHWATYGEGGTPDLKSPPHWYSTGWEYSDDKKTLCINPLSWRRDEQRVEATEHPGALHVPSTYGMLNIFLNKPTYEKITALPAVLQAWTWAQCKDGLLYVEPQLEGPFASPIDDEQRNYHTRDYGLFYQAIRENAQARAAALLSRWDGN